MSKVSVHLHINDLHMCTKSQTNFQCHFSICATTFEQFMIFALQCFLRYQVLQIKSNSHAPLRPSQTSHPFQNFNACILT